MLILALILGVAGSLLATAGPASAAVPGLVRIAASSETDSSPANSAIAECPAGKRLVGTGAEITEGSGKVGFDDLRPNGTPTTAPTTFTAVAIELDAFPGEWSVTAYAICANPLPGLSRHTATNALDSADFKDVQVMCPDGKKMTGLGGEITGAGGEAVFDDLRPNGNTTTAPTSNTVRAHEEDPLSSTWRSMAYGICANT